MTKTQIKYTGGKRLGTTKKKVETVGKQHARFRATARWKRWRNHMLKLRDYTCEISGFKRKKGLQIHHYDDGNYEDLKEEKFAVLTPAEHKLIERLLSRKNLDIDVYCENLKRVYKNSLKYKTNS